MKYVAGAVAIFALPLALILGLVLVIGGMAPSASGSGNACTPSAGTVNIDAIPADANVAGYGREQIINAAAIINAASTMGLPAAAQALGVQAAIGESSLVNINYGDGAINPDGSVADSIGLFQQQSSWGTIEQRMDPTTAATLFYQRLRALPGWEGLDPSIAINGVQINADPYHYTKYRAAALAVTGYLATLSPAGTTGGCAVSGDAQSLAQGLVVALDNGTLTLLEPRYAAQIKNMALGVAAANCQIDVRVLQLITLSLQKFEKVGISDLNRQCTGSLLGAGTGSSHFMKGGGLAVDYYSLNGSPLSGSSADNLALLDLLSSVAPDGTRAGQVNCRPPQQWANLTQFVDSCNHQHIDFAYTDQPLNVISQPQEGKL